MTKRTSGLSTPMPKAMVADHHHVVLRLEPLLPLGANACVEPGMIGERVDIGGAQIVGDGFDAVARAGIDDAGNARPRAHQIEHALAGAGAFALGGEHEIGAVEANR